MNKSLNRGKSPALQYSIEIFSLNRSSKKEKSPEYIFKGQISMNKSSRDKSPIKIFKGQISMNKSLKRDKSPTFQSSIDKSSWTHLHKRKNLLNKSSNDKSPWTNLRKGINLLHFNLQWINLYEHILKREKSLNHLQFFRRC